MNRLKKLTIILLMLIVCCVPIFVGCDFSFDFGTTSLDAPHLSINIANYTLSWSSISGASNYSVYCNSVLTQSKITETTYNFEELIGNEGNYEFYVVAKSGTTSSAKSNVVTYSHNASSLLVADAVNIDDTHKINLTLNRRNLTFSHIDIPNITYELYLYSNSTGLNTYTIDSNTSSISMNSERYHLINEIYAIRMGYELGGEHYVASDIVYLNPSTYSGYTDRVYVFDGYINDYYIENVDELRNLIYYSFIYRIDRIEMKLSSAFARAIELTYSSEKSFTNMVNSAVYDAFNYFFETTDQYNMSTAQVSASGNQYVTTISWGGKGVDTRLYPTNTALGYTGAAIKYQFTYEPYYEKTNYLSYKDKYGDDYDDFESDKQFLYMPVESSEELYWAVENKITPVFADTTSDAYGIYSVAKSILSEILSDEMTDYEKALSIFDWIVVNTNYDYYSLQDNSYSGYQITKVPCYYLEGVFTTHYAVCDGFAKAFSLMCNMVGIDSLRIVGHAGSGNRVGGHAWNKFLIDMDATDDIPAEWYVADITWTELGQDMQEVPTHLYFMLSDDDISQTHTPYNKRNEFFVIPANSHYNYYNEMTFEVSGSTYDYVITSEDELEALFDYMLESADKTMEVVITKALIEKAYAMRGYNKTIDMLSGMDTYYAHLETAIQEMMRSKKFNEQYLFLANSGFGSGAFVKYNTNGDQGVVYVFEQNFLIDVLGEEGHLVSALDHYDLYSTFDLYIERNILDSVVLTQQEQAGLSDAEKDELKAKKLFKSSLRSSGIDIDFRCDYVGNSTDSKSHFVIIVTEKITIEPLDAPVAEVDASNHLLTWSAVDGATKYDVYCNSILVEGNTTILRYNFEQLIGAEGEYQFYVIAKNETTSSESSNVVTYNYTISVPDPTPEPDPEPEVYNDTYELGGPITATISGRVVTFNRPVDNVTYILYLFSNTTGLNEYELSSGVTSVNLGASLYSLADEIYAIRIGYVIDNVRYLGSDILYYNPDNYVGYTDNIYIFDGFVNDYYIESIDELRSLIYYSFIYRICDMPIKLSSSFLTYVSSNYNGSEFVNKLSSAVSESFSYFFETIESVNITTTKVNATQNQYNINITFGSKGVDTRLYPTNTAMGYDGSYVYSQLDYTPYYEQTNYTSWLDRYGDTYDEFASDKQFLYTVVESSEELYWAVENHITPIFEDTESDAYIIYNIAKGILREIISDDMSDYEKVLSIFDWITLNTGYDYYSLQSNSYSGYRVTQIPCYYLDGVFITHYAVCDGFSKAYSLMCNMIGIDCLRVVGYAGTNGNLGGHAWNKVYLDVDGIGGEPAGWYVCDITWTEITSSGQEVPTHMYFLLSDDNISSDHTPFNKRSEFFDKPADTKYDYYNETTFVEDGDEYDIAITTKAEFEALFNYILKNNIKYMEVVVSLDLLEQAYTDSGYQVSSDGVNTYAYFYHMQTAINMMMKQSKFAEQYLFINNSGFGLNNFVTYNQSGDKGIVYVFEQNFLIDSELEEFHLSEALNEYFVNETIDLYIERDILDAVSVSEGELDGMTDDQIDVYLAEKLFANALADTDIELTFTLITRGVSGSSNNEDTKSRYSVLITPKN